MQFCLKLVMTSLFFYQIFIFSSGHCLEILSDKPDLQLREVWTYFNVVSVDKFVFTRCVECNGNCFISIPQKIALKLALNLAEANAIIENGSYEPLPFPGKLQSDKIENGLETNDNEVSSSVQTCAELNLNAIEDCDLIASQKCEKEIDYTIESDWFITRFVLFKQSIIKYL